MTDFKKVLLKDFSDGKIVFIGDAADAADIVASTDQPIVVKDHPVSHGKFFIGHESVYRKWNKEAVTVPEEFLDKVVIPWNTSGDMLANLGNKSIREIIDDFSASKAYINVTRMDGDVSDFILVLCKSIESVGVTGDKAGISSFISHLYDGYYRTVYVNPFRELNATTAFGIGVGYSAIRPTIVYPASYLALKMKNEEGSGC